MRDFPFSACPTAIDLFAYSHGRLRQDDLPRHQFIETHVEECLECRKALEALHGVPETVPFRSDAPEVPKDALSLAKIDAQREALRKALSSRNDDPVAGDLWVTRYPMSDVPEQTMSWLVLVMKNHWREYTREWVLDIVPVTEDANLAAEWSYVVPENSCDFGTALVAHLDFSLTVQRDAVVRRVARVADECLADLLSAHASVLSGEPLGQLRCGWLGTEEVRLRDEWLDLERALYSLHEQAALPFGDEDDGEATEHPCDLGSNASVESTDPPPNQSSAPTGHSGPVSANRELPTTGFTGPEQTSHEAFEVMYLDAHGFHEVPYGPGESPHGFTYGALLDGFLRDAFGGDFRNWYSAHGVLAPEDLSSIWPIPLPVEGTLSGMTLVKHLKLQTGKSVDPYTLRLLNDAVRFKQTTELRDEGLGKRAARRQSPGHENRS